MLDRAGLEAIACECHGLLQQQKRAVLAPTPPPAAGDHSVATPSLLHLTQRVNLLEQALTASRISWWDVDFVSGENEQVGCDLWGEMLGFEPADFRPTIREWDEMVHPDDRPAREAARQAHLEGRSPYYEAEYRMPHKDGHWVWIHGRGQVTLRDTQGKALRMTGTNEDITDRKQAEQALEKLTRTDPLTQLANRRQFFDVGHREFARAQRHGSPLSLLSIDLDHFKRVNDAHGHAIGDLVLQNFSHTVRELLRVTDLFARLGGEEFALLLPHTDHGGGLTMAHRIIESLREQSISTDSGDVRYTASVGLATAGLQLNTFEALLQASDRALYQAKALGRNRAEALAPPNS